MKTGDHIGARIRSAREQQHLSLRQLADRLDPAWPKINESRLSKFELGKYLLNFDQYLLICAALGVDPGVLAEGLTPPGK